MVSKVKFSKISNHKSKNQDFFSPSYSTVIMDSPIYSKQYISSNGQNKATFSLEDSNEEPKSPNSEKSNGM